MFFFNTDIGRGEASAALIEVGAGRPGIRRAWLRQGKAGNLETLFEMRRIIRESLGLDGARENKPLADLADSILREYGVRTGDETEINAAVFDWITLNVGYVQDRAGGYERLQYPLETVRRTFGDCDDLEILASALLALCGIQSLWLEAAKYNPATNGEDHVYGYAVLSDSETLYHDLTGAITEGRELGWYAPEYLDRIRVPVFADKRNTLFSGLLDNVIGGGVASIGPVLNYLAAGKAASANSKDAERQAGQAFERAAKATVDIFRAIQSKPVITADDYNTAAAALSALSDFADQYPYQYVTRQWESKPYKQDFETELAQIRAAALVTGNAPPTTTPTTGTTPTTTVTTGTDGTPITTTTIAATDSTNTLGVSPVTLIAVIAAILLARSF